MATCEVCGNDDDKAFEVVAPAGERCGCKVVGHGLERPRRVSRYERAGW